MTRDFSVEGYKALQGICKDFKQHVESGGLPESVNPGSPRYFSSGNEPGEVIRYLEARRCVTIERWEPDYALGDNHPQYVVRPTEDGVSILEKSRDTERLIFLTE